MDIQTMIEREVYEGRNGKLQFEGKERL